MKRLSADRRARRGSGQQRAARIDFKDNNSRSEAAGGLAHSRARVSTRDPRRVCRSVGVDIARGVPDVSPTAVPRPRFPSGRRGLVAIW